jgi:adenylate cyclase
MRSTSNVERERKFLVRALPPGLFRFPDELIEQGYLAITKKRDDFTEVRLRRVSNRYVLTAKRGRGKSRLETEVPITAESGERLWPLSRGRRVKKVRYRVPYRGLTIELDVYRGNEKGLVVAEVEFESADELKRFDPPSWFGREVTGSKEFTNSHLAKHGWKQGRHKE